MKISFTLGVLIFAFGMMLGWSDHQRLAAARELHKTLSKEAGLSSGDDAKLTTRTRRERRKPDVRAEFVMAEFLAFRRECERPEAARQVSKDLSEQYGAWMEHVRMLNPEELRILIQELRAARELEAGARWNYIQEVIRNLADVHPASALELMFSTSDLAPQERRLDADLIRKSIQNWAKDDPDSALKWLKENEEKLPVELKNEAKEALINGVASRDPVAAFRMLRGLGMTDVNGREIHRIVCELKTQELRMAAVTGIREYAATLPDEKKREGIKNEAISWLGYYAAVEDFESGSKWIAAANFTQGELKSFASTIGSNMWHMKEGDAAKWAQWTIETIPDRDVEEAVRNMVSTWARADYQAAADWIRATPGGTVKNTATRGYAEAVSRYEPESAVEWAAALPAGKERDATFKTIYRNWLEKDAEAAAAFAMKYGIK